MAIDPTNERLLSLTEASKVLPRIGGRKPAVSTLWRWRRKGLRGVCLEYLRVGRRIVTSREALQLWMLTTSATVSASTNTSKSPFAARVPALRVAAI